MHRFKSAHHSDMPYISSFEPRPLNPPLPRPTPTPATHQGLEDLSIEELDSLIDAAILIVERKRAF